MSDSGAKALLGLLIAFGPLGLLLLLRWLLGDPLSWDQYPRVEDEKEQDE